MPLLLDLSLLVLCLYVEVFHTFNMLLYFTLLTLSVAEFVFHLAKKKKNNNNNKAIRLLFQKEFVSKPSAIFYWSKFIGNINWKKVWLLPNKYLITNKIKEISFKILHKCYPAKHFFYQIYWRYRCKLFILFITPRNGTSYFLALSIYKEVMVGGL